MQNRTQHDLTLGDLVSLDTSHTKLHQAEEMIAISTLMNGESFQTAVLSAVVEAKLEDVHAHMSSHTDEEFAAAKAQLHTVALDVAAKKAAMGKTISDKNGVKEVFASTQGVFSPAIVARRAEVEAMLNNAAAEKSACNSDTEEVSSPEASPSTPRL